MPLTGTGLCALLANSGCALMLASVAIICAGFGTALTASIWPDVVVGIGIGLMNLDAAQEVWRAARREHAAVP